MRHTIKTLSWAMLLLFFYACGATSYTLAGKTHAATFIINPSDLYSTYEFSKSDRKELLAQGFNDDLMRNIEKMANETNWPTAISNLDGRFQLRDQLKQYKAFKIAQIGAGDKAIVAIPAAQNKKMPENLRPSKDIFFIMAASGLK